MFVRKGLEPSQYMTLGVESNFLLRMCEMGETEQNLS